MPQGGQLAVALRVSVAGEEEEAVPALHYTERIIPTVEVSAMPTPSPTAMPEGAASESTPTMETLAPTPDLTVGLTPSSPAVDPRLLGGGVAALIVVAALVTWPLWGRRR